MRTSLFFLCMLSMYISIAQKSSRELPSFPDYFNQHNDTINHYLNAKNALAVIKSLKKESVFHKDREVYSSVHFNEEGVQINKEGKPIKKYSERNNLPKSFKVYALPESQEEDYRQQDAEGYCLSEEYFYNSNSNLELYKKYNGNTSYDAVTFNYNKENQLVEKITKLYHGVSKDSYGRVYLQEEPTKTHIEKANYQKGLLVKLEIKVLAEGSYHNYTQQTEQTIEYGKNNLPSVIYKNISVEDRVAGQNSRESDLLKLDYTPENKLNKTLLLGENGEVKTKILYTYNNDRLNYLQVNNVEDKTTREYHFIFNKNHTVKTINFKLNENESEIYTYTYH